MQGPTRTQARRSPTVNTQSRSGQAGAPHRQSPDSTFLVFGFPAWFAPMNMAGATIRRRLGRWSRTPRSRTCLARQPTRPRSGGTGRPFSVEPSPSGRCEEARRQDWIPAEAIFQAPSRQPDRWVPDQYAGLPPSEPCSAPPAALSLNLAVRLNRRIARVMEIYPSTAAQTPAPHHDVVRSTTNNLAATPCVPARRKCLWGTQR